jgi:glycosyltransferase involved in cell wall biosynthesis
MNQKISFAIPTYKRPVLLYQTVQSIIREIEDLQFDITITDDSVDETNNEVVEKLCKEYKYIKYYKNEQNLGIDANILKSIDLSESEYVWIIGEDDQFAPGALKTILNILDKNTPAFLCTNYSYVNNDFTYKLKEHVINKKEDAILSASEFLEKYSWAIGFIGACIINKKRWNTVEKETYIGTYFAHVGTIFESIRDGEVYYCSKPLVYNRAEDTSTFTWSDKAFDVFYGWEKMLKMLTSFYTEEILNNTIENSKILFNHNSLTWIASKRADGIFNLDIFNRYIKNDQTKSHFFVYSALLIAILPINLFKILKFIRKTLPILLTRKKIN